MYSNLFWKKYQRNVNSSQGEDGVLEELLKRIGVFQNGWVCEFGAWDGIVCSNTFNLVEKKNFKAIYIEGDDDKFQDLLKTCNKYKNIIPIKEYVSHEIEEKKLDNILSKTDIPIDFDILSIDIDSYDYHVWSSLKKYKPKIVVIEINSSVNTNNNEHIHTEVNGIVKYQGTGFRPTFNLGNEKGYKFVLHTGNMIFVREDLFSKLNITYNNELDNFRRKWGAY